MRTSRIDYKSFKWLAEKNDDDGDEEKKMSGNATWIAKKAKET